jgi:predicted DNA-binding transcriptional regulator AlpA
MSPDVLPLRPIEVQAPPDDPIPKALDNARLIDRDEFAHRLSVGVSTLDRLRSAKRIGPREIKCGGVRFHLAEVMAWIATPTPSGDLHDAATWAPIWAALEKKTRS